MVIQQYYGKGNRSLFTIPSTTVKNLSPIYYQFDDNIVWEMIGKTLLVTIFIVKTCLARYGPNENFIRGIFWQYFILICSTIYNLLYFNHMFCLQRIMKQTEPFYPNIQHDILLQRIFAANCMANICTALYVIEQFDGSVQNCSISISSGIGILQSCSKPSNL